MSDDNLYYSKSKGKHIKIAEMPDVHVRRAFIKMNKGISHIKKLEHKLELLRDDVCFAIDKILEELNEQEDKD
tara:strand:- start:247 stop:465 length:219 start_codon:yes stop_codon:yes gene_type:complete